jgi:hypothetical protein
MTKSRLFAACATLTLLVAGCGDDDDDAASDGTSAATIAASADSASSELAEDCQTVAASLSDIEATPAAPEVGGEISDEYKEALRGIVDDLENLDLQTPEVRDAVGSLIDFANEVIDADTWSEEFDTSAQASFTPLTEACAAALAGVPTST